MDQVSYLDIWKAPLCVNAYWNWVEGYKNKSLLVHVHVCEWKKTRVRSYSLGGETDPPLLLYLPKYGFYLYNLDLIIIVSSLFIVTAKEPLSLASEEDLVVKKVEERFTVAVPSEEYVLRLVCLHLLMST